jgi:hydrogenase maturation protease
MRVRIIGLGNSILRDDAVGLHVARAVRQRLEDGSLAGVEVDVVEAEVGGFALMELMAGWDVVILVDAVTLEGVEPGTIVTLDPSDLGTSLRLSAPHEVDLPTALKLGQQLGHAMPRGVTIIGVQGADTHTFGEGLTAEVERAVPRAVERVVGELKGAIPRGAERS